MSELQEKLDEIGVTIKSTFNGVRLRDGWQCFAWIVTLSRGKSEVTTDFYTGVGHVKKTLPEKDFRQLKDGSYEAYHRHSWVPLEQAVALKLLVPTAPSSADVVNSMIGSACDQDFADWCSDFGYSDDSIKAKATYDACQVEERKAKRLLGSHYADVSACEH